MSPSRFVSTELRDDTLWARKCHFLRDVGGLMPANALPLPSLLMKSWIDYVMFSSLWLIADNDVWEVCQTGEHSGLPSAVGPGSGCVHLTNEMSHGEDGATRATKRSLQTNSPPASDCTNSPKFREKLAWPANWPHHSEGSFFRGVFGCGETARSGLVRQLCHLQSRDANSGPVILIGPLNAAGDPVSHLVLSSTRRRWVEVKSTLVSSVWTSKSAVERSEMCSSLHPPPQASLASLKFSAALPVGQVDPSRHWNSFGGH